MTSTAQPSTERQTETPARILVGYDGSLPAGAAIEVGASLIPEAQAWIGHLWTPPFASDALRRRLWKGTASINKFVDAVEREGAAEANRVAAMGVTLAIAAGWQAEALVERTYGGEGLQFTQLAEKINPDLLLVGSRGLGSAEAVLGSTSDTVVHYASRPVLVVAEPLLTAERAALIDGPVIVGWDGSAGAQAALAAATRLFPTRTLELADVDQGDRHPPPPGGHDVISLAVDSRHFTVARTVAETLADHARQRQAALVVVGSRGRSTVREILLGSVAAATLHHAHRPVMVVPRDASSDAP
ncbi:universal stress protein [Jidongwangia harbinensis]|uniref:universal stress protein n=1 Tax=Jidongwangia harbinensis TaxID=2878561 RepID=UPI001CDA252C|nr:universal stress protein [Jidongwangia harbinensis]MCA2219429.1 universal stress protein [Jidongwangia harbinensis]